MVLADLLPAHFADFIGVALGFVFHIIVQQRLVHHGKARAGQHVVVVRRAVRVHRAGAGAAVDGVHHRDAHQGYLAAGGQRQGVVVVLEQHDALALHLAHLGFAGGFQLGDGGKLAVKIPGVALFLTLGQGGDGLAGLGAQELVDLTGVFAGDDVAREHHGKQRGGDIQEQFFQRSLG